MSKAELRLGRQVQEIGAAIVETWFKLLPAPATILSVDSAIGEPLLITVNRRIFTFSSSVFLRFARDSGTGKYTNKGNFKVGSPSVAGDYHQQLPILDDAGTGIATNQEDISSLVMGLAIPASSAPATMKNELEAVLRQILDVPSQMQINAAFDLPDLLNVAVPRVPNDVLTREDLLDYLQKYHQHGQGRHYHEELGVAVLFGCR